MLEDPDNELSDENNIMTSLLKQIREDMPYSGVFEPNSRC